MKEKFKNKFTKKFFLGILSIPVFLIFTFVSLFPQTLFATAGVPALINFQGRLLDSSGNLLGGTGGTEYCYKFSIYDAVSSGSKIWPSGSPSTMTINTREGVFNANIGDVSAGGDVLDLAFTDDQAFVNIEVATKVGSTCAPGDGAESFETLSPRQRVVSSAFAINSKTVGGFTPAQSATGSQIPALTSGSLVLGDTNPGLRVTGSNTLTFQSGVTGDIQFYSSSNKITSSGALTIAGGFTSSSGTITLGGLGGGGSQCLQVDNSGVVSGTGSSCGAGSVTWNSLTDPTGTQTLAFGDGELNSWTVSSDTETFQTITANSLTTGKVLSIASSSVTSGSLIDLAVTGTGGLTNQKGLNISLSGANGTGAQTTYGAYLSNTHTGTSTNVGLYATASGGSINYAAQFNGDVNLTGANRTISGGYEASLNGRDLTLKGGNSAGSTTIGGSLLLTGGLADTGGNVYINGGPTNGIDVDGNIILANTDGRVTIGSTTATSLFNVGSSAQFQINSSGDILTPSAEALSITTGTTGALTLDSGTTGAVNLGTGNNAKTISIGTGTAGNTINIGTNNTVADTISIGSALDTLTITGSSSSSFVLNGTTVSASEFNVLDSGIERGDLTTQGTATDEYCLTSETGGGALLEWQSCGAGSSTWNSITNPTGSQSLTFDDGELNSWTVSSDTETFQTITANSLTTGKVLSITSSSLTSGSLIDLVINSSTPSNGQKGINISVGGATSGNATTYGAYIANTNGDATGSNSYGLYSTVSGTSENNIGLYVSATNGDIGNYALVVPNGGGFVGIGNVNPSNLFAVGSSSQFQVNSSGDILTPAAEALSITTGTTGALTLDTGTTGTLNLGTGNNAKTINLGTGTAGNTINIGTNNTVADTISIGSALDTLTITGSSSSAFVLNAVNVSASEFNVLDAGIELGDLTTQGTATDEYCLTSETGGGALLAWQSCGAGGGANPAGSGSELQYRVDGTTFGAITNSAVSGEQLAFGGSITSDYLLNLTGSSSSDRSRVLNIVQSNDTDEDSSGITLTSTPNLGSIAATRNVYGTNISLTPTATIANNKLLSSYGDSSTVTLSNITLGATASGLARLISVGSSGSITGSPVLNDTSFGDSTFLDAYGVYGGIGISPVLTTLIDAYITTSGGYFVNTSTSAGNTALSNYSYGIYANSNGNLTTTGNTTHYGGYFTAAGTADTNYGIYASVSGATTNYSGIFTGGNFGIGDSTPASLLTVGSGDLFQVNSSGAIAAATGITSSGTITFSSISGSTQCLQVNSSGVVSGTGSACGAGGGGLTVGTSAISSGGANRVLFENGSNVLSESANFTYDGTTLGVATASTTASNKTLNISQTGATSGTDYAGYFSNTGGATTNVGLYVTASGGTTNLGLNVDAGQTLLGGTTLSTGTKALLNIVSTNSSNGSTTAIAGIHGDYTFNNGGASSYVQVGNRFVFNNAPTTNSNTMVGEVLRVVDNTSLANLVRAIEITANAGSNTSGTNTGIRTTGATFGIQAITNGAAGSVSSPAAIFGESTGTTQGDILRLYTTTMTSAPQMAYFYHDTSTFTGTGLLMDFATGSGTFSGNFVDFQKNNTTLFKVTNGGVTSLGFSTNQTSTSAVCSTLANATAPTADTLYELRDCGSTPVADYAEMYPVEEGTEFGDIVMTGTEVVNSYDLTNGIIDWEKVKGPVSKLVKSNKPYQNNVIGIVSDNYGDFSSTGYNIKETDNPMPVALVGRIPVKISQSSSPILAGDYITTSDEMGKGMKALKGGFVLGKALEDWNPGEETVMVFVEQGYYDGISATSFAGMDTTNLNNEEISKAILAKLILDKEANPNQEVSSEILTDRLVAGLELITPAVVADSIQTDSLVVDGETLLKGLVVHEGEVNFLNNVTFDKGVEFKAPPTFNRDTAGFAVIKKGSQKVDVVFENPYIAQPVVTASISFEDSIIEPTDENPIEQIDELLSENDISNFFDEDIKYLVTNKTKNGFSIRINKVSDRDIKFSWVALAVKDANIFESAMPGLLIEDTNQTPSNNNEQENINSDNEGGVGESSSSSPENVPENQDNINEENSPQSESGAGETSASVNNETNIETNTTTESAPEIPTNSGSENSGEIISE
jgi:hypothetical protein